MTEARFEPRIVAFFCNWCTYTAADLAGISRTKYAPNTRVVRVMCSGRVDPQFVVDAFAHGADGVLIGGCHPGDCHYQDGNLKTLRRFHALHQLLVDLGIEPDRFRLEWISASEGDKLGAVVNDMVERVRALGPLRGLPAPPPSLGAAQGRREEVGRAMTAPRPQVAFYWCAGCGGCDEAVVDLGERLLDIAKAADLVFWPVALDFKRADVERLPDGALAAALVNGGIRTTEHEEMVRLLRRKARVLVALGACAQSGGLPGLANLWPSDALLDGAYRQSPTVVNPEATLPGSAWSEGGTFLQLPQLGPALRPLAAVVQVDYYLPGCPPPTPLLAEALNALLAGTLPERGSVLAPDRALCDTCPRRDSKPVDLSLAGFTRAHQVLADEERCLLAQGLLCLGAATRGGCEARCVSVNMPCTGCMGPTSRVRDGGAKILAALASLLDARDDETATAQAQTIVDPIGTLYRYALAACRLQPGPRRPTT